MSWHIGHGLYCGSKEIEQPDFIQILNCDMYVGRLYLCPPELFSMLHYQLSAPSYTLSGSIICAAPLEAPALLICFSSNTASCFSKMRTFSYSIRSFNSGIFSDPCSLSYLLTIWPYSGLSYWYQCEQCCAHQLAALCLCWQYPNFGL